MDLKISNIFEMRRAKRRIVIVDKLNTIIKLTNILNHKEYNSQITTTEIIRSTVNALQKIICK